MDLLEEVNDYKAFKNKDFDLGTSLGSFKLRSNSNLQFIKSGKKLLPYGHVEHDIHNEKYDFHRGAFPFGTFGKQLEEEEKAKPFRVKANWRTSPIGVIYLDDGKVDGSSVEWNLLP